MSITNAARSRKPDCVRCGIILYPNIRMSNSVRTGAGATSVSLRFLARLLKNMDAGFDRNRMKWITSDQRRKTPFPDKPVGAPQHQSI
jgi:hypothetical protein